MTTLQKTLVTAALTAAIGTGIYEAHQAAQLREQVQTLQHQQAPLAEQVRQLQSNFADATNRLANVLAENSLLKHNSNQTELLKLRGEVTRLRATDQELTRSRKAGMDPNDPSMQLYLAARKKAEQITQSLRQMPDKAIPELKLLLDVDWLSATKEAKFDTDADTRKTLSTLRSLAKNRMPMGHSLNAFLRENQGQLPNDLSQLKPYFKSALGDVAVDDPTLDAIFARYKLLHAGNVADYPEDTWFIVEKAPVDKDYDSRAKFGNGRSTTLSTGIGEMGDPEDNTY